MMMTTKTPTNESPTTMGHQTHQHVYEIAEKSKDSNNLKAT
jgi:hypothetical protein